MGILQHYGVCLSKFDRYHDDNLKQNKRFREKKKKKRNSLGYILKREKEERLRGNGGVNKSISRRLEKKQKTPPATYHSIPRAHSPTSLHSFATRQQKKRFSAVRTTAQMWSFYAGRMIELVAIGEKDFFHTASLFSKRK